MRVLLDTHVLLWSFDNPARIRKETAELLRDPRSDLVWSVIGTVELALKVNRGKLKVPGGLDAFLDDRRRSLGFSILPVDHRHALAVAGLPRVHGDPFDRLLVAQAKVEDIPLVTADPVLRKYGIEVIW